MPVILLVAVWLRAQTLHYSFRQTYVLRERRVWSLRRQGCVGNERWRGVLCVPGCKIPMDLQRMAGRRSPPWIHRPLLGHQHNVVPVTWKLGTSKRTNFSCVSGHTLLDPASNALSASAKISYRLQPVLCVSPCFLWQVDLCEADNLALPVWKVCSCDSEHMVGRKEANLKQLQN